MGDVATLKAYGSGSLLTSDVGEKAARAVGAERVLCEGVATGKNSSDICIAIDAIELALLGDFDVFVIVSRDSDFSPVAQRLGFMGSGLLGCPPSAGNGVFAKACNKFVELGVAKSV